MPTITAEAAGGNWVDGSTWVGGVAPTSADDVVLDASCGNVTVSTSPCACLTLDCTGYTGTLTIQSDRQLRVANANTPATDRILTLSAGMTLVCIGSASMALNRSANGSRTILTAGKTLPSYVLANYLALDDALAVAGDLEAYYDFVTNNHAVTVPGILTVQYGAVTLGSSAIFCGQWSAANASSINAGTSTITLTSYGGGTTFDDTTRTYYNIRVTAGLTATFGSLFYLPNLTVNSLGITGTGATTIVFYIGSTYTLTGDKAFFEGSDGNVTTMRSSTAGTAWNIVCASGAVEVDYVSLKDSAATGGATFAAGLNSTDVSGNSGWTFETAAGGGGVSGATGVDGKLSIRIGWGRQ